ncbi:hypothetical protein V1504DRAFT_446708 [Lipomyces starkeyi]
MYRAMNVVIALTVFLSFVVWQFLACIKRLIVTDELFIEAFNITFCEDLRNSIIPTCFLVFLLRWLFVCYVPLLPLIVVIIDACSRQPRPCLICAHIYVINLCRMHSRAALSTITAG